MSLAYRQQKVDDVHDYQNHMTDFRPAVGVGYIHKEARYAMMCEHLRVVFSSFLEVDSKHLLKPERELNEIVPLQIARYLARGPCRPEFFEVEPVRGFHE